MYIPKIACDDCGIEMEPVTNGVVVEVCMAHGVTYYKIEADRWQCPWCKRKVVTGFAHIPVAEHRNPKYETIHADTVIALRG